MTTKSVKNAPKAWLSERIMKFLLLIIIIKLVAITKNLTFFELASKV